MYKAVHLTLSWQKSLALLPVLIGTSLYLALGWSGLLGWNYGPALLWVAFAYSHLVMILRPEWTGYEIARWAGVLGVAVGLVFAYFTWPM